MTLSELRTKAGYTQNSLAQKLGTSVTQVSRWENGFSTPSLRYARPLAEALGLTLDQLASAYVTEEEGQ